MLLKSMKTDQALKDMTMDRMYDQSGVGPGSYAHYGGFIGAREWTLRGVH